MYVAFMERGELKVGASQMDAVERTLDVETIIADLAAVTAEDIVILDANLHPNVMERIVDILKERCMIFFEPISSAKAARHADHLADIFILTPDRREFEVLLGEADPDDAAVYAYLSERNIEYLLATRGREGAPIPERHWMEFPPGTTLDITDSTGAGDMLTALLAQEIVRGAAPENAVPACMARVEEMLAARSGR